MGRILRQLLGPTILLERINTSPAQATNIVLDGSTEKIAFRFRAMKTSGITDVAVNLSVTGSPGMFRAGIFAETVSGSSFYPDTATQLGGYTGNFSAPASPGGFTALLALGTATGDLSVNSYYWLVIEYVSGTIDASNYIQARRYGSTYLVGELWQAARHFNGTNWTTTSAYEQIPCIVLKHADGTYSGQPMTAAQSFTSNDIYGTNVQGIKFKVGAQLKIQGVGFCCSTKTGTPGDLTATLYEGDTSKASGSLAANRITANSYLEISFDTPALVAADTDLYLILSNSGGSSGNYYRAAGYSLASDDYVGAVLPPDWRTVYGSLGVPSGLTVNTSTIVPIALLPYILDPALDLDQAAGGGSGGGPIFGEMVVQ